MTSLDELKQWESEGGLSLLAHADEVRAILRDLIAVAEAAQGFKGAQAPLAQGDFAGVEFEVMEKALARLEEK